MFIYSGKPRRVEEWWPEKLTLMVTMKCQLLKTFFHPHLTQVRSLSESA